VADTGADLGAFDVVLTCVPAPQAITLLTPVAPELAKHASTAVMHPTWATMLILRDRTDFAFDGAFLNDDPTLGWISRDSSKPGRADGEAWVLHATRAWTTAHLEEDTAAVASAMSAAFCAAIGTTQVPVHGIAHRWRYALPDPVTADAALYDPARGIGAGGDWCGGPRVEGALLSGIALAGRVLTHAHVASV
jgi:hypothetical protein